MKKFLITFFAFSLLGFTNHFSQTVREVEEDVTAPVQFNPTSPVVPISVTSANERAPFITGDQNNLYTIIEYTDSTKVTVLRIFLSKDGGETWEYKKTLRSEEGSLTLPQAFVFQGRFYAAFQFLSDSLHSILVYENDDPLLNDSGTVKIVETSKDWLERASILVKPDSKGEATIHVAYFNLTQLRFYIREASIDKEFITVYSRKFNYPDGFLRISATAGKGMDMFAFNVKIDSVNQIVVLEHTLADGWHVKFFTKSPEMKSSPSIAAWGKNWIITYRADNSVFYLGQFLGYGFVKNQILGRGVSFPIVDITDSPAGKIVCVFARNGKIFKKESSVKNPIEWSESTQVFQEAIPPSDDDFISLFPNFLNGGIAFATFNQQGNFDVYFSKIAPNYHELNTPTNLTASLIQSGGVQLNWEDNSLFEDGFQIFRRDSRLSDWEIIDTTDANVTSYADTTVLSNRTYSYLIKAIANNALSKFSNLAKITTPPKDVPNVFYYKLQILLKNTPLGDIRAPILKGSLLEYQKYYLPTYNFSSVYQGVGSPYKAVSGSYFSIGNISDDDLFLDISLVYDYSTNLPPRVFNEKLFLYLKVKVFKLPDYTPVTGDYVFNQGEYFTFHISKKDSFIAQVKKLSLNPDSLQVAYITDNGFDGTGITTINTKNFLEFKASHFSKFGGGRHGIANTSKVETGENTSLKFKLGANYPNPFNPTTTIAYTIPGEKGSGKKLHVSLKVYHSLGQEVATLVNRNQSAGNYKAVFNAKGLPSGVYFYRLTAGSFSETRKMILLK